jgi:hypothetical protein
MGACHDLGQEPFSKNGLPPPGIKRLQTNNKTPQEEMMTSMAQIQAPGRLFGFFRSKPDYCKAGVQPMDGAASSVVRASVHRAGLRL